MRLTRTAIIALAIIGGAVVMTAPTAASADPVAPVSCTTVHVDRTTGEEILSHCSGYGNAYRKGTIHLNSVGVADYILWNKGATTVLGERVGTTIKTPMLCPVTTKFIDEEVEGSFNPDTGQPIYSMEFCRYARNVGPAKETLAPGTFASVWP